MKLQRSRHPKLILHHQSLFGGYGKLAKYHNMPTMYVLPLLDELDLVGPSPARLPAQWRNVVMCQRGIAERRRRQRNLVERWMESLLGRPCLSFLPLYCGNVDGSHKL